MARWPLSLLNRRRVLLVADDALLLATTTGGAVELELSLPFGEESDLEPLLAALRRRRLLPLTIFMDVLQQSYRREILPQVSFFDQPQVVARRLDLSFPQSELRAALRLPGRPEEGGPRRLEYILAALPKAPQVDRLLAALAAARISVASICLLPIEGMSLVGALGERLAPSAAGAEAQAPPRWSLLVSPQRSGGIRQIVTKDGRLVLSRLTPDPTFVHPGGPPDDGAPPAAPPETLGEVIAEELNATLGYLSRLGYSQREGLRVIALCDPRTGEALQAAGLAVRELQWLTPADAGRRLGLSGVDPDESGRGDLLFVAWLGRQLFPVMPMLSREQRLRRRAGVVAAAAAVALVVLALDQGVDVGRRLLAVEESRAQLEERQELLRRLRVAQERDSRVLEGFPVTAAALERSLELHRAAVAQRRSWSELVVPLAGLSGTMQQLTGLVWQREAAPGGERIELTFDLAPGREPEEIAAQTEALLAALRQRFPGHRVAVRDHALDLTAGQALRGGAGVSAGAGLQPLRPLVVTLEGTGS